MAQVYVTADGGQFTSTSLRLPVELKNDLDDLARATGNDVSSILIEIIEGLTEANKDHIEAFRKLAAMPIVFPRFVRADEEADEDEDEAEE